MEMLFCQGNKNKEKTNATVLSIQELGCVVYSTGKHFYIPVDNGMFQQPTKHQWHLHDIKP